MVQSRAFFETLEFGDTVLIVRHGPLTIEAQCDTLENGFTFDRVRLIVTTTVPGVVAAIQSGDYPIAGGTEFLDPTTPEDRREVAFHTADPGVPSYSNDPQNASIIAPSGEVILIDGETLGLGLNIFDVDCLAAGTYQTFKGRL